MFDPDSDEEADYDLEPDEDELEDSEDESILDGLDDLADPRVAEVDEDEEAPPTLVTVKKGKAVANKNKNKRPASDSDDEDAVGGGESLDEMIAKQAKAAEPTVNGEQKLSKKQLKKLKKNDGAAATPPPVVEKVIEKKEVDVPASSSSNKSDKKVSFAKELEQGPTPTPTKEAKEDKSADKSKSAPSLGVKTVQGVTIDDKKLGSGQAAKNGDRVGMRYIGKLKDGGQIFDSNKKGKPFSFKLGAGEVIKGWEIGLQGMQAGGERRITIPAHVAYGSKKMGQIPANSALIFDVKMLEINKK
jgi:FK506-binding nuclear protein